MEKGFAPFKYKKYRNLITSCRYEVTLLAPLSFIIVNDF